MKLVKYIVGAGLAFFGGRYLYQLHRAGEKVAVDVNGRVHKVALSGVEVVLNYNIKNPTYSALEMTAPLIQLAYEKKVLATSSMAMVEIPEAVKSKRDHILIRPFQETGAISTTIMIPHLSILTAGADLLNRLRKRLEMDAEEDPIQFEIKTTANVFTKLGSYPYDETVKVSI